MGVRSWIVGWFAPTRRTRRRTLPLRADRRLAAKERHRQDGGPLWSECDRHVRRSRLVRKGYTKWFTGFVTVIDDDDPAFEDDDAKRRAERTVDG